MTGRMLRTELRKPPLKDKHWREFSTRIFEVGKKNGLPADYVRTFLECIKPDSIAYLSRIAEVPKKSFYGRVAYAFETATGSSKQENNEIRTLLYEEQIDVSTLPNLQHYCMDGCLNTPDFLS